MASLFTQKAMFVYLVYFTSNPTSFGCGFPADFFAAALGTTFCEAALALAFGAPLAFLGDAFALPVAFFLGDAFALPLALGDAFALPLALGLGTLAWDVLLGPSGLTASSGSLGCTCSGSTGFPLRCFLGPSASLLFGFRFDSPVTVFTALSSCSLRFFLVSSESLWLVEPGDVPLALRQFWLGHRLLGHMFLGHLLLWRSSSSRCFCTQGAPIWHLSTATKCPGIRLEF